MKVTPCFRRTPSVRALSRLNLFLGVVNTKHDQRQDAAHTELRAPAEPLQERGGHGRGRHETLYPGWFPWRSLVLFASPSGSIAPRDQYDLDHPPSRSLPFLPKRLTRARRTTLYTLSAPLDDFCFPTGDTNLFQQRGSEARRSPLRQHTAAPVWCMQRTAKRSSVPTTTWGDLGRLDRHLFHLHHRRRRRRYRHRRNQHLTLLQL